MLIVNDTPRVWRKRERPYLPVPTPSGVRVVSVDVLDGTGAVWTFDAPVTVQGDVAVPQLRIRVAGEWVSAVTLGDWSESAIACDFDTDQLSAGLAWEIVTTPVGIGFGGMSLLLPQSGVTGIAEAKR